MEKEAEDEDEDEDDEDAFHASLCDLRLRQGQPAEEWLPGSGR